MGQISAPGPIGRDPAGPNSFLLAADTARFDDGHVDGRLAKWTMADMDCAVAGSGCELIGLSGTGSDPL